MWGMRRLKLPNTSGWDIWGWSVSQDDGTWYVMVVVGSSATGWGGSAILTATDCCGGWTKTNRTPALPVQSPTEDGLAESVSSERVWQWVLCGDWSVVLVERLPVNKPDYNIVLRLTGLTSSCPVRTSCVPPCLPWRGLPSSQTLTVLLRPRHLYFLWRDQDSSWHGMTVQTVAGVTGNLHGRQAAHWSHSCHRPRALSSAVCSQWRVSLLSYPAMSLPSWDWHTNPVCRNTFSSKHFIYCISQLIEGE